MTFADGLEFLLFAIPFAAGVVVLCLAVAIGIAIIAAAMNQTQGGRK